MRAEGLATAEGTARFARRFWKTLPDTHFRSWRGLTFSSIGLGTYLGEWDDQTDALYRAAVERVVDLGCNVIDTAVNYRFQRSERAVGEALEAAFAGGLAREAIVISTKGGFIPFDRHPPADARAWIEANLVKRGVLSMSEVVADCHCLAPGYLKAQLETSLRNLRLEAIDIYYLHNPETQLPEVGREEFLRRMRAAFGFLEQQCDEGRIGVYGIATWGGLRQPEGSDSYLSLAELLALAQAEGGEAHRFRAVQLPLNLAMPEALIRENQAGVHGKATLLDAAAAADMIVMSSGSIYQGQLARGLPSHVVGRFSDLETDAQRALQFARSAPGVTTALVGMKNPRHVEENLALARVPPAPPETIKALYR